MSGKPGRTWQVTCRRCGQKGHLAKTHDRQQITANGETLPLEEWAGRVGISAPSLVRRIERGLTPEEAVTRPRGWRKGKSA